MKILGAIIREAREKRELSMQDIHERTRIAIDRIEMIEKGEWDELPMTYYRSFIRSLSQELELDGEKLLDELDIREYDEPEVVLDEDLRLVSPKSYSAFFKINNPTVLILAIVFGIIIITIVGIQINNRYFVSPSENASDSTAVHSDSLMAKEPDYLTAPFVVTVKTQKDIQLLVQLDRSPSVPVQVRKDRTSQWSVNQSLQIVLEKPESLEILLDGKPLDYTIKEGIKRPHLKITRDGVEIK